MTLESLTLLHGEGILSVDYVQKQTEAVEMLLAGINTMILDKLSSRERDDREHFGKMRDTTEARLIKSS